MDDVAIDVRCSILSVQEEKASVAQQSSDTKADILKANCWPLDFLQSELEVTKSRPLASLDSIQ